MQHKALVKIPASEEMRTVKTTCDYCHDEIEEPEYPKTERVLAYMRAPRVKLEMSVGECYGDGGSCVDTEFDFCARCFREYLIPWVKSRGGNEPRVKEIDY